MSSAYPVIWAMKHAPVADVEERVVLIAMADAADSDGCNSYRSMRGLMNIATGISESTIRRRQQAMAKRGLIRLDTSPPPARYLKIPANRRPPRWELCIPYSWWSDDQRAEIQREREDRGLPLLTPQSRPDLPPAPPRKHRADKGKPNPNRRRKQVRRAEAEQQQDIGGVSETPQPETGGESWGVSETPLGVSSRQPRGCLEDTQPSFDDPPRVPSPDPVVRPVRAVQLGDARARATAPQAANDDQNLPAAAVPEPRTAPDSAGGEASARGGPSRRSEKRSASPSPLARQILGEMPRAFRDGAPGWLVTKMAERIDRWVDEGWSPAAVVRAAHEVAAARPISGDHFAALRQVRAALTALAHDPDVCGECGAERFPSGRCPTCDADAPMTDEEAAEMAAARARLAT